jgi:hypothetical protein
MSENEPIQQKKKKKKKKDGATPNTIMNSIFPIDSRLNSTKKLPRIFALN